MKHSLEEEHLKAFLFYEAGHYKEAALSFDILVKKNPFEAKSWFSLASSYQQLQEYHKALPAWAMSAFLDSKNPYPHFHAAECLLSMDKKKEALLALKKAKTLCNDSDLLQKIEILEEIWNKKEHSYDK